MANARYVDGAVKYAAASQAVSSGVTFLRQPAAKQLQTFTFVYSDVNGAAGSDIGADGYQLDALSSASACYVYTTPSNNAVYLSNDAGSGWSGPFTLGSSGTLQNSQCSINVGASSGVISGNTYTLHLAITFQAAFTGTKNIYGLASQSTGGLSSGWQALGTWTVATSSQPPQAVSASPSSGSGASQTFTFVYSDVNGAADLTAAQTDINSALSSASACYVYTTPSKNNAVYLSNDAGSGVVGAFHHPGFVRHVARTANARLTLAASSGANIRQHLHVASGDYGSRPPSLSGTKNIYGLATQVYGRPQFRHGKR